MDLDGPREACVRWGPQVLRDVAMATNFWLSIGYNVGCMIASNLLFDSRMGFGIKLSDEDITEIECLGSLPWQPISGVTLL